MTSDLMLQLLLGQTNGMERLPVHQDQNSKGIYLNRNLLPNHFPLSTSDGSIVNSAVFVVRLS